MNRVIIAAVAALVAISSATAAEKKVKTADMLGPVCESKAVKSEKLTEACDTYAQVKGLTGITVKAPAAEVKVIYANLSLINAAVSQ